MSFPRLSTTGLVQPKPGVIFGLGFGTRYVLRPPEPQAGEARRQGATTTMRWSGGKETDLQRELGLDWLFGNWVVEEAARLRTSYFSIAQ